MGRFVYDHARGLILPGRAEPRIGRPLLMAAPQQMLMSYGAAAGGGSTADILYHFDGANGDTSGAGFADASGNARDCLPATGTAAISTAQSLSGGSSLRVDNSAGVVTPYFAGLSHGSSDFTYEWFMRLNANNTGGGLVARRNGAVVTPLDIQMQASGTIRVFGWNAAGSDWFIFQDYATALSLGVWYHIAFVRYGSNAYLYKDGTAVGSPYALPYAFRTDATEPLRIGRGGDGSADAWIEDFRLHCTTAVYTANFTAPTAPLA